MKTLERLIIAALAIALLTNCGARKEQDFSVTKTDRQWPAGLDWQLIQVTCDKKLAEHDLVMGLRFTTATAGDLRIGSRRPGKPTPTIESADLEKMRCGYFQHFNLDTSEGITFASTAQNLCISKGFEVTYCDDDGFFCNVNNNSTGASLTFDKMEESGENQYAFLLLKRIKTADDNLPCQVYEEVTLYFSQTIFTK